MTKIDYALQKQESLGKNETREYIMVRRCPNEYGLKNTDTCHKIEKITCEKCWEENI